MQRIAILTDTTSDVDPSIIKEYNIVEVPLQIIYNSEVTYKDKYEKILTTLSMTLIVTLLVVLFP